jgi:hypothetical protein
LSSIANTLLGALRWLDDSDPTLPDGAILYAAGLDGRPELVGLVGAVRHLVAGCPAYQPEPWEAGVQAILDTLERHD